MTNITQTIENALYTYDPNEYMPIYEAGELANRSAFIAYKMKRTMQHLGQAATAVAQTTGNMARGFAEASME